MDNIQFARYTKVLLSLIIIEASILLATCWYLEPVIGDTTRISGYSENDFGWNIPQRAFEKNASPLQKTYDHYADVLVLGDSFSFGGVLGMMNYPWQTFLTAYTGLTVSTISHYTTMTNPPSYDGSLIPAILNSETFQKTPPKVFILEVVERQLNKLPKFSGDCQIRNKITNYPTLKMTPVPELAPNIDVYRKKVRPPFNKQLDFAVKFWETLLLLNVGDNQAYLFNLLDSKLFSNKRSDTLLVYEGDVKKKNWDETLINDIRCRLINLQNFVQSNGKTLFVVMIAPDKLTAYSRYLEDKTAAEYTVIHKLASDKQLHLPRFDLPLQKAIENRNVDLYLPNDTHWASKGQQVAAQFILDYLKNFNGDPND